VSPLILIYTVLLRPVPASRTAYVADGATLHVDAPKHAEIILCTASTASRKSLRRFKLVYILVEGEASQMSETTHPNAIARYIPNINKNIKR
jgi:hypothetical protein